MQLIAKKLLQIAIKNNQFFARRFTKTFTFTPLLIQKPQDMKKYAVILVAVAAIAIVSACSSSNGTCPAYSQNDAQQIEQLAQR